KLFDVGLSSQSLQPLFEHLVHAARSQYFLDFIVNLGKGRDRGSSPLHLRQKGLEVISLNVSTVHAHQPAKVQIDVAQDLKFRNYVDVNIGGRQAVRRQDGFPAFVSRRSRNLVTDLLDLRGQFFRRRIERAGMDHLLLQQRAVDETVKHPLQFLS